MKWILLMSGTIFTHPIFVLGQGPVLLYSETFPYDGISGSFPVSSVGWANDIPDNPNRLYQVSGSDGAIFAYEGSLATTAFYTSTTLSATTGAAFPNINTALYTDITFSVDIAPYYTPANVKARFAVQMNGGSWFVSTNILPVPATTGPFATYSNVFNPIASHWDTLTVSGNGTGNGATIGDMASGDLTGNITGGPFFTIAYWRPLAFGQHRPWQPVHVQGEIVQPAQIIIGGKRPFLQHTQKMLRARFQNRQRAQAVERFLFDGREPAPLVASLLRLTNSFMAVCQSRFAAAGSPVFQ